MSLRDSYIAHLKNLIEAQIAIVTADSITTDFHDEFSYNDNVDLDVTVKMLPGQIQVGVVQYPGELLISINETCFEEVLEALTRFTIANNEKVVTLDGKYREYYNTPNVVGTFQNAGINNKTSVSISFSLITFDNIYGLDPEGLTLCCGDESEENLSEVIKWLSFTASYAAEPNGSGSYNGDTNVRQVAETASIVYSFTFVPKIENNATKKLLQHIIACPKTTINNTDIFFDINQKYVLGIRIQDLFGTTTIGETVTNNYQKIDCIVLTGTFTQESNGLPIVQVSLQRGDF